MNSLDVGVADARAADAYGSATPPAPGRSVEIEIKLAGGRRKVAAAALDAAAAGAKTSPVESAYYDAEDGRLWRAGYTLRLRPKKGRYELTLKTRGTGAMVRGEWTALLDKPIADLTLLPRDAPMALRSFVTADALRPVFRTEIERSTHIVDADGARAEIAIDQGRIVASNGKTGHVREIELELIGGAPEGLVAQAKTLAATYGLHISTVTKADRGFGVADGRPPPWARAEPPDLRTDMTTGAALSAFVASAAAYILGNVAAAADGRDPEGVHQLRVGLRRLRSAVALFGPDLGVRGRQWNRDAKRALRALGPARDLDVFLAETLPAMAEAGLEGVSLQALRRQAEEERLAAYVDVRRMLKTKRFTRLCLDLMAASIEPPVADDRPVVQVAAALLQERLDAALAVGKGFARLSTEDRHRVRIAVKKLRYALDFCEPLFPEKSAAAYLKRLKRLQEDLGLLNDAAVAGHLAAGLAAGMAEGQPRRTAEAGVAVVARWQAGRLDRADKRMVERWAAFAKAKPFWRRAL